MKCEKFSIHWYYLSLFTFVQTDPIQSLLSHFDGEVAASNRQTLNADSVTQDDKGIQELIEVSNFLKKE